MKGVLTLLVAACACSMAAPPYYGPLVQIVINVDNITPAQIPVAVAAPEPTEQIDAEQVSIVEVPIAVVETPAVVDTAPVVVAPEVETVNVVDSVAETVVVQPVVVETEDVDVVDTLTSLEEEGSGDETEFDIAIVDVIEGSGFDFESDNEGSPVFIEEIDSSEEQILVPDSEQQINHHNSKEIKTESDEITEPEPENSGEYLFVSKEDHDSGDLIESHPQSHSSEEKNDKSGEESNSKSSEEKDVSEKEDSNETKPINSEEKKDSSEEQVNQSHEEQSESKSEEKNNESVEKPNSIQSSEEKNDKSGEESQSKSSEEKDLSEKEESNETKPVNSEEKKDSSDEHANQVHEEESESKSEEKDATEEEQTDSILDWLQRPTNVDSKEAAAPQESFFSEALSWFKTGFGLWG